eukprot:CAMPEP_0172429656 /NCGR_PEP_ID=MMETSP1064-20121228/51268_1 /TAXON_ID=202472 /ORGANISM="Aulacoseira subarctica , Strain CCAP 1002/5" /LENGTH=504 /DNA_ID=CAMNT_0013175205 /DNA_START=29 /DNA_END=1539 /DNA_ORIENTATION=+
MKRRDNFASRKPNATSDDAGLYHSQHRGFESSAFHLQRLWLMDIKKSSQAWTVITVLLVLAIFSPFICLHHKLSQLSLDTDILQHALKKDLAILVKDKQTSPIYSPQEIPRTQLESERMPHEAMPGIGFSGAALDDSLPLIHIVNTRFQQHAHNLTAIGTARLELFETFCLPTMIHQTIQPQQSNLTDGSQPIYRFLWIIKTDPKLDLTLRNKMAEMLKPYPNFFLVGSLHHFSWRGGKAGNELLFGNASAYPAKGGSQETDSAIIYAGDESLLRIAHAHSDDKIVLETRLDADDGLPLPYLEYTQTSAMERLSSEILPENDEVGGNESQIYDANHLKKARWMFWCMPKAVNWHSTVSVADGLNLNSTLAKEDESGILTWEDRHFCLTPGLTTGLSVGVRASELPSYEHHRLLKNLDKYRENPKNNCGLHDVFEQSCIQVLDVVLALRARTPTSAGMKDAVIPEKFDYSVQETEAHWSMMKKNFAVEKERVIQANRHMSANILP